MTQGTQSAGTPAGKVDGVTNDVFGLFTNGNGQAISLWVRSNQAAIKGTIDITQQIFAFGQARLTDDIETLRKLSNCRDVGEMVEHQKLFAERVAEQYMDQANKLATEVNGIVTDALGSLRAAALKDPRK